MPAYRRSYNRFKVNRSCFLSAPEGTEQSSILKDLSARGAGILSHMALAINQKINLVISAPFISRENLSKQATVVWSKEINNGLWQHGLDFGEDSKIYIPPDNTGLSFS
ncbi:MAG: PilZ domain-containing protein [Candidatus Omnitrophota bacterium]